MRHCIFLILLAIVPNIAFAVDLNSEIDAGLARQKNLHSNVSYKVGTSEYTKKKSKKSHAKVSAAPMTVRLKDKRTNVVVTQRRRTVANRWEVYPPARMTENHSAKQNAVRKVASKNSPKVEKKNPKAVAVKAVKNKKALVAKAAKKPAKVAVVKKKKSPERVAASVKKSKKNKKGFRGSNQKIAVNS